MSDANVDVPAVTITEQTGDQRTLTLTERALPYRPLTFSGSQRAEFTAYPGNPVRTLQVLGPEEAPTDFTGYWKDRFLDGGGPTPAYYTKNGQRTDLSACIDIVNLVDDIRRKGQEVVVQWGPIARRGLLKQFDHKWHNLHDVEWTMRFEWSSQNDPEVPAVLAKDTDSANIVERLTDKVNSMADLINKTEGQIDDWAADKIAELNNFVTSLTYLVDQVQGTTTAVQDTFMPVMDQYRRLAGIYSDIASTADDASDDADDEVPDTQVDPTIDPTEGPVLAVTYFIRLWTTLCRDLKFLALQAQVQVLKATNPNIQAAFTARQNTDLRDVSTQYYGTPDEWRSLMLFNELATSKLNAGDTVFVPLLLRPLDGSQ